MFWHMLGFRKSLMCIALLKLIYRVSLVALYTIVQHSAKGFEHEVAHWVMSPFFKDHTSYGMALALLLPFSYYLTKFSDTQAIKLVFTFVFILLIIALILSYTRAAWLSCVLALCVYIIMKLRIRFFLLFHSSFFLQLLL